MAQICSGLPGNPSLQMVIMLLRTQVKTPQFIQQKLCLQDETIEYRDDFIDMANGCLRYSGQVRKIEEG